MKRERRSEEPVAIPLLDSGDSGRVLEGRISGFAGFSGLAASEEPCGALVMAPPHPQYGGNMEHPVVSEIADAGCRVGLASLRFNWRGTAAEGTADYAAALAFAQDNSEGPITACGYSFGAASAARAVVECERVKALLLVAPPMMMLDRTALNSFPGPILLVAGDRDEYAPCSELEALVAEVGNAELALLPGTDHYFASGLAELGRVADSFLQRIA